MAEASTSQANDAAYRVKVKKADTSNQANDAAYPVQVKKEDTSNQEEHSHSFFFKFEKEQGKKSVTCKDPGTVLEALQRCNYLKGNEGKGEKYPIIKMGKANDSSVIATHFPCHLIRKDETLTISFASKEVENAQPREPQRTSCVTFHINKEGGTDSRSKSLFRNPTLKKFTSVCVYAEKGTTLRDALKRDGRFLEYITDGEFSLYDESKSDCSVDCAQDVDEHNGKHFDICIPRGILKKKVRDDQNNGPPVSATKTKAKMSTDTRQKRNCGVPENTEDPKEVLEQLRIQYPALKELLRSRFPNNTFQDAVESQREQFLEEVLEQLRKQCPALKELLLSRFPNNTFQDAVESKREEFPEIQQAFSEVHRLRQLLERGKSVCQLKVKGVTQGDKVLDMCGTGFVLFDNFILTNAHLVKDCVQLLNNQWQLTSEVEAIFNFEKESSEMNVLKAKNVIIDCNFTDDFKKQELDYAILELDQTENIPEGLFSKCGPVPTSGGVCIIGHPKGELKKLDLTCVIEAEMREERVARDLRKRHKDEFLMLWAISNKLIMTDGINNIMKGGDKEKEVVTYKTFMYHGSSGSPVFDDKGCVFGLHTAGFPDVDSVIEFAHPLTSIIENFMRKLKANGQVELLEKVDEEVKKNPYLYELFQDEKMDES